MFNVKLWAIWKLKSNQIQIVSDYRLMIKLVKFEFDTYKRVRAAKIEKAVKNVTMSICSSLKSAAG